jgi:protein-disulfide isomerase
MMKGKKGCCFWVFAFLLLFCSAGYGQSQSARGDGDEIMAVINGSRVITRKEIDTLVGSQLYSLEERIYNLRKNALNNLIMRILLEEEARRRGVTVEELKDQLVPDRVEVKQSQVEQVYAENIEGFGAMSEDEAKQRIKLDLQTREKLERYKQALAALRSKAALEMFLSAPLPPVVAVNDDGPSIGPKDALVTIVEFSDFQCPYCKQATETLKRLQQNYGSQIRLVFKHLPLPVHPQAFKAAQAAVCAGEQGKFWEYHDRLFAAKDLSDGSLAAIAEAIDLRKGDFKKCLDSEASRAAVLKDMQEARRLDVHGTPTFFINGRPLKGVKSINDFENTINQELRASQKDLKAEPSRK